jgi:hypothetical protein
MYCKSAAVLHEGRLLAFDSVDAAYDFYQGTMAGLPHDVEV